MASVVCVLFCSCVVCCYKHVLAILQTKEKQKRKTRCVASIFVRAIVVNIPPHAGIFPLSFSLPQPCLRKQSLNFILIILPTNRPPE